MGGYLQYCSLSYITPKQMVLTSKVINVIIYGNLSMDSVIDQFYCQATYSIFLSFRTVLELKCCIALAFLYVENVSLHVTSVQYIGGCSVHRGDNICTCGGITLVRRGDNIWYGGG